MKNNSKIYIFSLIFTLVSLFLVVFFVLPLSQEIVKNSKELISAKENMAVLSAQIKETENFKKNSEVYLPNLAAIDKLFINPDNPVDFIKFLEDTAASSQITSQISLPPSSQGLQQSQNSALRNFITFQFASKGNFSDVLNFAKKIEAGTYLIEVENLTIQNSQENDTSKKSVPGDYSSRKVEALFAIKAFVQK